MDFIKRKSERYKLSKIKHFLAIFSYSLEFRRLFKKNKKYKIKKEMDQDAPCSARTRLAAILNAMPVATTNEPQPNI